MKHSTHLSDRPFDLFLSVPEPQPDSASFFRRILSTFQGCHVGTASGTYHVRLRFIVKQALYVDAAAVRSAITDHLRLRAPRIILIGVRVV